MNDEAVPAGKQDYQGSREAQGQFSCGKGLEFTVQLPVSEQYYRRGFRIIMQGLLGYWSTEHG
jgi:hypothetical protein